jgi:multiple sugar transport system substrate-binding protein
LRLVTLAAIPVLVISACSSTAATPSASTGGGGNVSNTVRWFVGLGSGTQPAQIAAQKAFVASYNSSNPDGITVKLEIVPNANAYDVLKTEIAAGNGPDIIGPVGVKGRNGFEGLFLDLSSQITANNFDLSAYDPALVAFFQQGGYGQVGLPYLIFPGYLWYNKDLFSAANLPALPTTVGATYQGQPWSWDTLRTVAQQLTKDSAGKKSTDAGFDATKIVKYGIGFQWADGRRLASCWGGGSFVGSDNKTAQIPDIWKEAFNWYYNAIWTDHISPDNTAINSALLGSSNLQSSGNIAMNAAWGWSISSIASDAATAKVKLWDLAVLPTNKAGGTSSPMDADTFTITKASKNPGAAFKAMVAIMADDTLMKDYGGEPAKTSLQAAYFTSFTTDLAKIYPGITVTWSVLAQMAAHPAVPSHEANMPAFTKASDDYGAFYTKLQSTKGLDVNAELEKLRATLQTDFDNAQPLLNQ